MGADSASMASTATSASARQDSKETTAMSTSMSALPTLARMMVSALMASTDTLASATPHTPETFAKSKSIRQQSSKEDRLAIPFTITTITMVTDTITDTSTSIATEDGDFNTSSNPRGIHLG